MLSTSPLSFQVLLPTSSLPHASPVGLSLSLSLSISTRTGAATARASTAAAAGLLLLLSPSSSSPALAPCRPCPHHPLTARGAAGARPAVHRRCPSPPTARCNRASRWPQAWLPLGDASSLCSVCARVIQETLAVRARGCERPAPTPPPAVVPYFRVETLANDSGDGGCVDGEIVLNLLSLVFGSPKWPREKKIVLNLLSLAGSCMNYEIPGSSLIDMLSLSFPMESLVGTICMLSSKHLTFRTTMKIILPVTYRCNSLSVILLYCSRLLQADFVRLWKSSFFWQLTSPMHLSYV